MSPKKKDPLDGAYYTLGLDKDKTPADFKTGKDGLRPGQQQAPSGKISVDLTWSVIGKILPPRSIWRDGHWKNNKDKFSEDYEVWVVSGEGTPGNYEWREYKLPETLAYDPIPKHPNDWTKAEREGKLKSGSSGYAGSWGSKKSDSPSSDLPFGLRIRCPKCGHFFKVNDLADHAKSACPASQQQPAMWVIECECHPGDLQKAATILDGFPVKVEAPDKSGEDKNGTKNGEKSKEKPEEKPKKTGVVVEAPEKAGSAA